MFFAKKFRGCVEAGIGCCGESDLEVWKFFLKFANNGFGSIDFAHAYGMYPDTFFVLVLIVDFSETVLEALFVSIVSDDAIEDER